VQPAERLLRRPGRGRESRGCLNRPMVRRCPYYFGAGMKPVFASTAAPKGASSVAFTMYPRFNIMLICATVSTDAVFVYVMGHDLQTGGENFVVPTDANFETAATLRKSALALSELWIMRPKLRRAGSFCSMPPGRSDPPSAAGRPDRADRLRARTHRPR
jgi:hypothetical protein